MPHTKATRLWQDNPAIRGILASGSKSRQKNRAVGSLVRFAVPSYEEGSDGSDESDESDESDGRADVREAQWAGEARFLAVCCGSVRARLPFQGAAARSDLAAGLQEAAIDPARTVDRMRAVSCM